MGKRSWNRIQEGWAQEHWVGGLVSSSLSGVEYCANCEVYSCSEAWNMSIHSNLSTVCELQQLLCMESTATPTVAYRMGLTDAPFWFLFISRQSKVTSCSSHHSVLSSSIPSRSSVSFSSWWIKIRWYHVERTNVWCSHNYQCFPLPFDVGIKLTISSSLSTSCGKENFFALLLSHVGF